MGVQDKSFRDDMVKLNSDLCQRVGPVLLYLISFQDCDEIIEQRD